MAKPKSKKSVKPLVYESDQSDEEFGTRRQNDSDSDDISSISFGTLNKAQKKIRDQEKSEKPSIHNYDSDSDVQGGFFDGEDSDSDSDSDGAPTSTSTKKHKHAPKESSSKRPVKKYREIPGLDISKYKEKSVTNDIRFNPAFGAADLSYTRDNYRFLDEYRQDELNQMQTMLKDRKSKHLLKQWEKEDIQFKIQSLQSRVDTLKNRDLNEQVLAQHKREQRAKVKSGEQTNMFYLKDSEKRKMLTKLKFEGMKGSQREKVMERKRKRRLGREFRELEFNQRG
ncbi:hypothetical protein BABINDRAFT_160783 [Babjeviella inositovora NRRL Y-12698]|uniref:rRNA biogenesis protein RRP36 n=1 Tax=Babjeviella inositovora NRRL Y-12698 TaxID=984486 RepID=A0A1E3QS65_9ASCO|nr:uncharacterized protein BABINDRAFT_160783 [Babjeviella inositovora NRRL Y-12698]ODQ80510.1 hypothetical protein BABINDRAFT_160783 [Babjeviella inositovora NRRL Y-12698]